MHGRLAPTRTSAPTDKNARYRFVESFETAPLACSGAEMADITTTTSTNDDSFRFGYRQGFGDGYVEAREAALKRAEEDREKKDEAKSKPDEKGKGESDERQ